MPSSLEGFAWHRYHYHEIVTNIAVDLWRRASSDEHDKGAVEAIGGYVPRADLAIVAGIPWTIVALFFWLQFFRQRWAPWILTLVFGTSGMAAGYAMRLVFRNDPTNEDKYLGAVLPHLISPTLIFSVDYEGLSKLANYIGPNDVAYTCLPAPADVLSKMFLAADLFALVFEVSAGVLVSKAGSDAEKYRTAHRMGLAGMVLQAITFSVFTIILLLFGYRVSNWYPDRWNINSQRFASIPGGWSVLPPWNSTPMPNWKLVYYAIVFTCFPYLARSGYRIYDFWINNKFAFHNNDFTLFMFDSVPLFVGIAVFIFIWPPRFLKFPRAFRKTG